MALFGDNSIKCYGEYRHRHEGLCALEEFDELLTWRLVADLLRVVINLGNGMVNLKNGIMAAIYILVNNVEAFRNRACEIPDPISTF